MNETVVRVKRMAPWESWCRNRWCRMSERCAVRYDEKGRGKNLRYDRWVLWRDRLVGQFCQAPPSRWGNWTRRCKDWWQSGRAVRATGTTPPYRCHLPSLPLVTKTSARSKSDLLIFNATVVIGRYGLIHFVHHYTSQSMANGLTFNPFFK